MPLRYVISFFALCISVILAQTQPGSSPIREAHDYPVLPNQKIGPNDLVAVSVYDQPELTRLVRVTSDGFVRLALIKKPISAQGLMPSQLEEAIAAELKAEQLVLQPIVTVTMAEYKNYSVTVMGSVKNPLTFQAPNPVKLLDALSYAGGLTADAGSEILVTRSAVDSTGTPALTQRIAVSALIDSADPEFNLALTGGEEIRVPEAARIYVVGDVKQPGAFPVRGKPRDQRSRSARLSSRSRPPRRRRPERLYFST